MLRSDSSSSYTDHHGSDTAADAAAAGSVSCQQEGVSDSDKDAWMHQAPPYDLSQLDDNLLEKFSVSQVTNTTWLHLAAPFDLALLNDNLLSAQDCVSVSYMCSANPLFLPQMHEQPSLSDASAAVYYLPRSSPLFLPQMIEQIHSLFGSLASPAVCYMCQSNPLFLPVAYGGATLSTCTVHASTATSDAFLHMAAPTNLDHAADPLDHNLLASTGSKANMAAWLHLAPPFDLAAMDDDLLSGIDVDISSKTHTLIAAWLHQAPPFDLAAMDDDLLAGIVTGAAAA
jgi:hypothetical protein